DAAGHPILVRRGNVDLDGTTLPNAFVDRSATFDAAGNRLSSRVEIDGDDAHDLVTRYAYDGNDQLAVVQQPEGNRTFQLYDERRSPFKVFYGVARSRSGDPTEGYPADRHADTLGGATAGSTAFVGLTVHTY